jgi:hypothetical protein
METKVDQEKKVSLMAVCVSKYLAHAPALYHQVSIATETSAKSNIPAFA